MPVCVTCGEEDFELQDGFYYCVLCHTQTQEMHEEEVVIEDTAAFNVLSQNHVQKAVKEKKSKAVDKGRPWHTHEAWTIILKKQVEALIQLGADPQLKDVVLELWIKYLSKCGVAFTDENVDPNPVSLCRDRDQNIPSVENPEVKNLRVVRSFQKRQAGMTTVKQAKAKKEKAAFEEVLGNEEFYEGDNPFEDEDEEHIEGESFNKQEDSSDSEEEEAGCLKGLGKKLFTTTQRRFYKQLECMTAKKTLVFCYLGLIQLHSLFTPIDLLRWVEADKVPFKHQLFQLLPQDMKFCFGDFRTFHVVSVPSASILKKEGSDLTQFLDTESLYKPANLSMLCSRYIIELNLPGEFHNLTRKFLKRIPNTPKVFYERRKRMFFEHDNFCIAVVVVVLKIMFMLNDEIESKISTLVREVQKSTNTDLNWFCFEDWLHCMENTVKLQYSYTSSSDLVEDISSVVDIAPILESFKKKQGAHQSFLNRSLGQRTAKKYSVFQEDKQETLQRPFITLQEKYAYHYSHVQKKLEANSGEESGDEDKLSHENPLIAMLEESAPTSQDEQLQGDNKEDRSLLLSVTGARLRKSTICYITEKDHIRKMKPNLGSQVNVTNNENANQFDDSDSDIYDPSQSLFSQSQHISLTQVERESSQTLNEGETGSSVDVDPVTWDMFQDEVDKLISRNEYWPSYPKAQRPRSYNRVLAVCSQIIGCSVDELHSFVHRVEAIYLYDYFTVKRIGKIYKKLYFEDE